MDLKPANILFDLDMNPVIVDFGLSRVLDDDDHELLVDTPLGTVGYMAPEQIETGTVSKKTDIYALGVALLQTIGAM
ncbi:unnamed protein product [Urochloa humidicola]